MIMTLIIKTICIILFGTIIFLLLMAIILFYEYIYMTLNERKINAKKDIAAIIMIRRDWYDCFSIYYGVSWLIRLLKKEGPFMIFRDISREKFIKIIKSPKYTKFYIFGHGWIGGIHFPKGIKLIYYDIDTKRKAKFVGQYHCNHGKGVSLAEKLKAKEFDINYKKRLSPLNYLYFMIMYFKSRKN